ncbi:uncharacterized protein FTOL_00817 [Fusarium torulosum]|uniref:Uncharacterized protein n=1 Tax=Fusarium torulosum TaxID=33205 RepID=A0AAE8LYU7_9HYPO|nr:uncharacterized protein FTOL_00817 [Fusarium torulosum]
MATQVFRAVVIQTPQPNKDMLVVKVDGREDMYPQSGDPCDIIIESAMFEKTSDEHDEAALDIYKALKAAEPQRDPLAHSIETANNSWLALCHNQKRNETSSENYEIRVLSLYKTNPYLFSKATSAAAADTTADANDDSKRSFRGHCVDCIDSGIPAGLLNNDHHSSEGQGPLPSILNASGDGPVEIGSKMTASHRTIKAQSIVINALEYPQTAKPRPPVPQSQQAYRYTLRFDPREASQVDLIKEFPGIANVIDKKAAPAFIQSIFDALPSPMKTCLIDLQEGSSTFARPLSYLMEVLILFAVFGNGLDNLHNLKILYIMNNNDFASDYRAFNVMRLYPLEGEVQFTDKKRDNSNRSGRYDTREILKCLAIESLGELFGSRKVSFRKILAILDAIHRLLEIREALKIVLQSKTTSNPFAFQKQTSLLHRVVEGGARHSALSINMRAHGNLTHPVNHLYYNGIMLWRHSWKEGDALEPIIAHFQANSRLVNDDKVRLKYSAVAEAKPRQDDVEKTNIAEEFVTSEVIRSLYKKVSETKSAITQSKNANRDKSLHQFARSRYHAPVSSFEVKNTNFRQDTQSAAASQPNPFATLDGVDSGGAQVTDGQDCKGIAAGQSNWAQTVKPEPTVESEPTVKLEPEVEWGFSDNGKAKSADSCW